MAGKVMKMTHVFVEGKIDKTRNFGNWEMAKMHAHGFHELYFLLSGTRRYFVEDTLYDLEQGDLILIPKNVLHRSVFSSPLAHERYCVYFSDERVRSFAERAGAEKYDRLIGSRCIKLPAEVSRQVQQELDRMYLEQNSPNENSHIVMAYCLENVLLQALCFGEKKEPVTGKSLDRMQEVAHYISEHYASNLTLQDAANIAHMEATYFSKCFKAATGEGFQEYLTKIRLRKAEQLLEHSSLSVYKIAEACGFSNSNYFGDVFRRRKNCSPLQYRKQSRQDRNPA